MRFYDVVVLGRSIGALASAAMLSRRGFRVLVVGDGARPSGYAFDGLPLRRRAPLPLPASTPVFRRLLAELAQYRPFTRKLAPHAVAYQAFERRERLEMFVDADARAAELDRESPHRRAQIETWIESSSSAQALADRALDADLAVPPTGFWERREANKAFAEWPLSPAKRRARSIDPRAMTTGDLRFDRAIVDAASALSDAAIDLASPTAPAIVARLHATWMRDAATLPGDDDAFADWLVDRLVELGADVRLDARCEGLIGASGVVKGVQLDTGEIGDAARVGCTFVVSDRPGPRLVDAFLEGGAEAIFVTDPPSIAARRFVASLVVDRALAPASLARDLFVSVAPGDGLSVRVRRATFDDGRDATTSAALNASGSELWIAETRLADSSPLRAPDRPGLVREAIVRTLKLAVPFLDRHLRVVDSPHDGAPLWDFRSGRLERVRRSDLRGGGGALDAEDAPPIWSPRSDGFAGICGESTRVEGLSKRANVLTVATSVVPSLGLEGQLLAAAAAARIVTKSDPRREQMRKEMWARIEF